MTYMKLAELTSGAKRQTHDRDEAGGTTEPLWKQPA